MATFRIDALGRTPARLRNWLDRARKATAGRSAPGQLGLIAVTAGCLAVAGCLAAWSVGSADRAYLASGRFFRPDDLHKIERALQSKGIDYRVDDRRVSVAGRQAEAAAAIVAGLDLGPRSPRELRDVAPAGSFWERNDEKENRLRRERDRFLEAIIDELPGVEGSLVQVNRTQHRSGIRLNTKSTAFVRVQTDGGRDLPLPAVDSIVSILTGNEPGLQRDAITVMDGSGRRYLDAGNPAVTASTNNRAREEEVSRRILEQLDWIKDVRVTVTIHDPPPVTSPATDVQAPAPRREAVTSHAGLSVGLNRAMEIEIDEEEPAPAAEVVVPPLPAPAKRRGEVWVLVPRSFYYNTTRRPEGGAATHEDHVALMNRTEGLVVNAVRLVASDDDEIEWMSPKVDVLPDEMPAEPMPSVVASASRRTVREWALAGGAGAAAAAIVAFGTWILGGLQPSRRSSPSRSGLRYHRGSPGTPAPTERVLEFVRRNPETAFSVLNRWTAQGGGRS